MNEESRPARRLSNDHPASDPRGSGRYSAPAILIRLELEAHPRVLVDAIGEREHTRLIDWLEAHPRYLELVQNALALEREERAA